MEQKFINKEISGIKESNIEKLKQLFPSVIKDGQVDLQELKNQLGEFEEVTEEKYEFNWVGKQEAKQNAISGIQGATLKYIPEESKNFNTTENLYIEGDNLKVLKLLKNNYANKIKMIYIDPPYNTGNDTFVYPDSFKKSSKESEEELGIQDNGERLVNINNDYIYKNLKDSNMYHSAWLSMMYPRLKTAQELLNEDGVIFISIDDNEYENLRKICNEIFGENNFIANLIWRKKTGSSDAKGIAIVSEYILVYVKGYSSIDTSFTQNKDSYDINRYKLSDEYVVRRGKHYIDNLDRGSLGYVKSLDFGILAPDGTLAFPNGRTKQFDDGWRWTWGKEKVEIGLKNGFIEFRKSHNKECGWTVCRKNYINVNNEDQLIEKGAPHKNMILDILNTQATVNLEKLFGTKVFSYTKPTELLKLLISFVQLNNEDIVLDFFSGSATTAQAAMQLNAEDGGNRKYIMVQLPELCPEGSEAFKAGYKDICEIGKERIRRAGDKIKQELIDAGKTYEAEKLDIGFKVFKVDETNINWEKEEFKTNFDKHIAKHGMFESENKDMLTSDFVKGAKDIDIVYELLLRYYGVPLTEKVELMSDIGPRTYSIGGIIIVCLEDLITKLIIDKISSLDFSKLYLRDSSFKGDNSLELKENLMIRLNLQKGFKDKDTYKVEFI